MFFPAVFSTMGLTPSRLLASYGSLSKDSRNCLTARVVVLYPARSYGIQSQICATEFTGRHHQLVFMTGFAYLFIRSLSSSDTSSASATLTSSSSSPCITFPCHSGFKAVPLRWLNAWALTSERSLLEPSDMASAPLMQSTEPDL